MATQPKTAAATVPDAQADLTGMPARQCATMADIRREIDRMDRVLVRAIAERVTYIERAAEIKTDRARVRDTARIEDVIEKVKAACAREGLKPEIAEPVWRAMMERCIAHEFALFDALAAAGKK
ncbi:MAG TPA: chorismate mutase [Micropepsaceae bacterium]|nr:chorismate mutase [Micropepsaceae bacterium]